MAWQDKLGAPDCHRPTDMEESLLAQVGSYEAELHSQVARVGHLEAVAAHTAGTHEDFLESCALRTQGTALEVVAMECQAEAEELAAQLVRARGEACAQAKAPKELHQTQGRAATTLARGALRGGT